MKLKEYIQSKGLTNQQFAELIGEKHPHNISRRIRRGDIVYNGSIYTKNIDLPESLKDETLS